MTVSSTSVYPRVEAESLKRSPAAALFCAFLLLRLFINSSFLDQFVSYSSPGGSIIEKIHPANYFIFFISVYLRFARPQRQEPIDFVGGSLTILTVFGILWAIYTGNTTSIGFLVDNILFSAISCWGLSRLRPSEILLLFNWLKWALYVHAMLIIYEFLAGIRVLPYAQGLVELSFRPTGLLAHPLNNGLVYAVFLPMAGIVNRFSGSKLVAMGSMLTVVLCSGARFASIVSLSVFLIASLGLAFHRGRSTLTTLRNSVLIVWMLGLAIVLLYAFILYLGLDYRLRIGLFDESSNARFEIYRLLDFLSPSEFYFGAGNELLTNYAMLALKARAVESPIVIAVYNFGAIYAGIFFTVLALLAVYMFTRGVFHFRLSLLTFVLVALSNNVLMTKFSSILLILILFNVSELLKCNSDSSRI